MFDIFIANTGKKSGEDFVHSAFQHLNIGLLTNIHLLIYMFQLFFASLL